MPTLVSGPDSGADLFGIASLPMDVLISTPTLKRHKRAGVSGTLKHYATFRRSGPAAHHANGMQSCASVVHADFATVRKLHIADLIRVGTAAEDNNVSPVSGYAYTKALVIGSDPVSVDRVALDIYLWVGMPDLGIDPLGYINAGQNLYGFDVADLAGIDVHHVTA